MRKSKVWIMSLAAMLLLVFGTSAYAFQDVPQGRDYDKIMSLKERGIIQGDGKSFHGSKKLTHAEGVQLIVKGLDLNLAAFLFMKEPKASDWFTQVKDDAWYSQSFVIAGAHDIGLPQDVKPNELMTREQYIHYLYHAMMKTGDYPFTKMYFNIKDNEDITSEYRGDMQLMLNARIISLDEEGSLYPKRSITRQEAAVMLYDTIEFVNAHKEPIPDGGVTADEQVAVHTVKVNDEVNKVILSLGEKPNAGYTVEITRIEFGTDHSATVYYRLQDPKEGEMYAQVITTPEAHTFVSSQYEVTAVQE